MTVKKPQLDQTEIIDELPAACGSEAAAVAFFEAKRWRGTPCCPTCGDTNVYAMKDRKTGARNKDFRWRCRSKKCGRLFTVRTGMIFEESLVPMQKWARVLWEAGSCKNGVSALEISRKVQVTYRTALFMLNRLRHAMAYDPTPDAKLTGTVEADETYVGGKPRRPQTTYKTGKRHGKAGWNALYPKTPVFAVVQRGGNVRAQVMANVNSANVKEALLEIADTSARLMTDESTVYCRAGKPFASHGTTKHSSRQYVSKTDPTIHSNSVESFFARVKRQLNGTFHAVSKKHLHRYISQAAFLHNTRGLNDGERVEALLERLKGKRLMFRAPAA